MKTNRTHELILVLLIVFEIVLFSFTGLNFLSLANFFECVRLAAEIGLLALALTPVIVSGGIDLSVGSAMGLCAVIFGALWQDAHFPIGLAIAAALLVGLAGGAVNGLLISRFNVSALIVTLGTYSLFRGLAEGITTGARGYSGFPQSFLFLGQGYWGGIVPTQTIILVLAIVFFWILLSRSVIGRGLYAIGHSSEAARYAGIPVRRNVALVYLLSGFASAIAAIIYVAHLGQARSDAGTGYELIAITAVVLGGTSIFGGSGTIGGTLLGLTAIVLLQNGLRLSAWPSELAGILTGFLLVVTVVKSRALSIASAVATVTVISLIAINGGAHDKKHITIGVMPKAKGDPYFMSCRKGAEEAAKAMDVDLIWDGPTGMDAAKQNEVVEGWITRRVDAISVAVANSAGISSVLRKARSHGIKVVTWDADADPDSRDYFVNQATPKAIGYTLIDEAARIIHEKGEIAIITGALSAANQNEWIAFMRERLKAKYPAVQLLTVRPSDDDRDKAFSETQTLMKVYPNLKVVVGISAPAVPGAGEAVKQSGRKDVVVIGLSLPNLCKPYVRGGEVEAVVLWNTTDLGYLAVAAPAALVRGAQLGHQGFFDAGRLGKVKVEGSEIILGNPAVYRKDNIGGVDF